MKHDYFTVTLMACLSPLEADTLCCPHTCMYTSSPVSFSWHSMDMGSLAFWHAVTLFCMCPQNYTMCPQTYSVVTAVLSLVATCMVSWNRSVEYMYTKVQWVCMYASGGRGLCLRQSVIWIMWPHTFTCSFCDCHWCLQSGANVPSKISLPFRSPNPLLPHTCVQTCPIADSRHSVCALLGSSVVLRKCSLAWNEEDANYTLRMICS